MRTQVLQLLDSFCDLLDKGEFAMPEEIDACVSIAVEVAGISFLIKHLSPAASCLHTFCRFGPILQDDALLVMKRLLEINLALSESDSGTLGCDGPSGDIVFSFALAIHGTTAQDLLQALQHAASQARCWRNDAFLSEEAPHHRETAVHA